MVTTFNEMNKRIKELLNQYDTYNDLIAAFIELPKNHEDYIAYEHLIKWCNN